jgi:hypothetical protein
MATMLGKIPERGVSGLFLFEEAANGVDRIIRILLLLRRGLGLRTSAPETAQLRLQHARGDSPHVGDKFGIFRRSFDLERDCWATTTACVLAIAH